MSLQKAGIIVSIFFVIFAVILCILGYKYLNPKESGSNQPPVETVDPQENQQPTKGQNNQQNIENQNNQQNQQNEQNQNNETTQVPPVEPTVIEKVVTKEVSGVQTINENSLGEPVIEKEVIVRITNKRVMLIDEKVDSSDPKMLTYCFDVLTPDNMQLTLFITNIVYVKYNVGDVLKVNYQIYRNNNGIEFPLVLSVTDVE